MTGSGPTGGAALRVAAAVKFATLVWLLLVTFDLLLSCGAAAPPGGPDWLLQALSAAAAAASAVIQ